MRGDQSPGNKASTGRQLLQPMDRALRLRQHDLLFVLDGGLLSFRGGKLRQRARANQSSLELPHLFHHGLFREGLRVRRARLGVWSGYSVFTICSNTRLFFRSSAQPSGRTRACLCACDTTDHLTPGTPRTRTTHGSAQLGSSLGILRCEL